MTRVADSSFLITFFDRDDPRHGEARERAREPEPILVPPEVLGETLGVVHARHGYGLAHGIWQGLLGMPNLSVVEDSHPVATGRIFEEAGGTLSWVDAAVVARCREEEAEVVAFDPAVEDAVPG